MTGTAHQTGYADVSGLEMYYEIHDSGGVPLALLLGGGVAGDVVGLPASRLAVLPGATHITLVHRADWLQAMVTEFLDAPMPESL